ncbi:PAS domain S-box protein [Eleftheria terrae]|nr:PAS domain S-box protein [Eleftheria terrae]WKB52240.1 PAS domain S-box protein [Eleftheria terrae]
MKLVQTQYRDLLAHTPDAILIVNATGHIILTNSRAEGLFGYPREALLGQAVEMLLPPHARELHLAHRGQFLEQPRGRSMGVGLELYGQRRDGEEVPVEISLSPLSTGEGPMVMCAVRDITERQETRRRTNQMFRALLECAPMPWWSWTRRDASSWPIRKRCRCSDGSGKNCWGSRWRC